jgi:hypothetical protein
MKKLKTVFSILSADASIFAVENFNLIKLITKELSHCSIKIGLNFVIQLSVMPYIYEFNIVSKSFEVFSNLCQWRWQSDENCRSEIYILNSAVAFGFLGWLTCFICAVLRFKVFIAVSMKMAALWYIVPCCLTEVDQCFRGYLLSPSSG